MFWGGDDIDAPVTIDLGADVSGDSLLYMYYWIGVSTTEAASGYGFDGTCTDDLGCVSQFTAGTNDGSIPSALTGEFTMRHADGQPSVFTIGYFSPFGGLRLSYKIWCGAQPGTP